MARSSDVSEALATLQARWGGAAPRRGGELGLGTRPGPAWETEGALARAVQPLETPDEDAAPGLHPIPGPGPLAPSTPRRGAPAQDADGRIVPTGFAALDAILGTGGLPRSAIVAWLDLARSFDPVEAVARGVRPEWLVVLTPADLEEALAMAGSLLAARTVDLLVVDLPDGRDPAVARA